MCELLNDLDFRWEEVDLLIEQAENVEESNPKLYSALSRSISVLVVAHLEGFIKDLAKALIQDINQSCNFNDLSDAIQRTYTTRYVINNKESNPNFYINQLVEKFKQINCKISHEPFLKIDNKNPKPDMIKTILLNFGIKNAFSNLKESNFDEVFEDIPIHIINEKTVQIKESLISLIGNFPYTTTLPPLKLEPTDLGKNERTLWQTFLDDINQRRHEVAHGNIFNNSESPRALRERRVKLHYLQLALIIIISTAKLTVTNEE